MNDPAKRLNKELSLFNIYSIAIGATLSSGLFLLPGLAYAKVGSSLAFAYLIAGLPLIPGIFSIVELSTAMPRSGGMYYFLDRSLGSLFGTIGGLGVFLVVVLKSVIALLGASAYMHIFFPDVSMTIVASAFAVIFTIINLAGAKKSSILQSVLVILIFSILLFFTFSSIPYVKTERLKDLFQIEYHSMINTSGMLVVSYVGLTKIASIAEEVKQPERNLPLGVFLALGSALLIYLIVGLMLPTVLPGPYLSGSLTPLADAASIIMGRTGAIIIGLAALFAFSSVANASILTSSRYPLAMSRDSLIPSIFGKLNARKVPVNAIFLTFFLIMIFIVWLKPVTVAKLASSFQLLVFSLVNIAVIIMRESKIQSYDPGYRSPFYPYLHILGIFLPLWFIHEIGIFSVLFTISIIFIAILWYFFYARKRIIRRGAIYHYLARLGEKKYDPLDTELRGILREKGLRKEDPFDSMITRSIVIDLVEAEEFSHIVEQVANLLENQIPISEKEIIDRYMNGTRTGATPVSNGSALPHIHVEGIDEPYLVLVRVQNGVIVEPAKEFWGEEIASKPVYALFFLVGSEDNPKRHLRILAQIAERIDREDFISKWLKADSITELQKILLSHEHVLYITLMNESRWSPFIGKKIMELNFPDQILLAMIEREGQVIIPKGNTQLNERDELTIIGEPHALVTFQRTFRLDSK